MLIAKTDIFIPLDSENQVLRILTNSQIGSGGKIYFNLYTSQSDKVFGNVQIMYQNDNEMTYHIGWCTEGYDNKFDKTPTITTPTTWKITKDKGNSILIWCNEELVLTYKFESSPRNGCVKRYEDNIARIKFIKTASVSDLYEILPSKLKSGLSLSIPQKLLLQCYIRPLADR